jgi:hypothetical protein
MQATFVKLRLQVHRCGDLSPLPIVRVKPKTIDFAANERRIALTPTLVRRTNPIGGIGIAARVKHLLRQPEPSVSACRQIRVMKRYFPQTVTATACDKWNGACDPSVGVGRARDVTRGKLGGFPPVETELGAI